MIRYNERRIHVKEDTYAREEEGNRGRKDVSKNIFKIRQTYYMT